MRFRWCSRSVPFWLGELAVMQTGSPALAQEQIAVRVHVSSLEELVADAATAARNFPQQTSLESLLKPITRTFGLSETTSWAPPTGSRTGATRQNGCDSARPEDVVYFEKT